MKFKITESPKLPNIEDKDRGLYQAPPEIKLAMIDKVKEAVSNAFKYNHTIDKVTWNDIIAALVKYKSEYQLVNELPTLLLEIGYIQEELKKTAPEDKHIVIDTEFNFLTSQIIKILTVGSGAYEIEQYNEVFRGTAKLYLHAIDSMIDAVVKQVGESGAASMLSLVISKYRMDLHSCPSLEDTLLYVKYKLSLLRLDNKDEKAIEILTLIMLAMNDVYGRKSEDLNELLDEHNWTEIARNLTPRRNEHDEVSEFPIIEYDKTFALLSSSVVSNIDLFMAVPIDVVHLSSALNRDKMITNMIRRNFIAYGLYPDLIDVYFKIKAVLEVTPNRLFKERPYIIYDVAVMITYLFFMSIQEVRKENDRKWGN